MFCAIILYTVFTSPINSICVTICNYNQLHLNSIVITVHVTNYRYLLFVYMEEHLTWILFGPSQTSPRDLPFGRHWNMIKDDHSQTPHSLSSNMISKLREISQLPSTSPGVFPPNQETTRVERWKIPKCHGGRRAGLHQNLDRL